VGEERHVSEVKIGIVGLSWGRNHVTTFHNLPGARVTAVAYRRPLRDGKTVAEYAAEIGARAYDDGVRMIAEADIDAVDICTSPRWREPLVAAAARRRLPVLIEKPMALSVAHARRMAAIAADAGIPLMLEYPLRFHPAMQRIKELLGDGPLGAPISVEGSLQTTANPPPGHWTWDAGNIGGVVLESGCHLLDSLCFLCGSPRRVMAMGRSVRRHGTEPDTAALLVEFESGCQALANIGGLGAAAHGTPMLIRVVADKGEAWVTGENWMFGRVRWAAADKDARVATEDYEVPPRLEIQRYNLMRFLEVVRDKAEPPASAADGIRVQQIVEAMAESIRTGRAVDIR
jgi:myo-inositol 2-dehydrogenase / D-chiro-inositol 1-dehydrogenase